MKVTVIVIVLSNVGEFNVLNSNFGYFIRSSYIVFSFIRKAISNFSCRLKPLR